MSGAILKGIVAVLSLTFVSWIQAEEPEQDPQYQAVRTAYGETKDAAQQTRPVTAQPGSPVDPSGMRIDRDAKKDKADSKDKPAVQPSEQTTVDGEQTKGPSLWDRFTHIPLLYPVGLGLGVVLALFLGGLPAFVPGSSTFLWSIGSVMGGLLLAGLANLISSFF